MGEKPLVSVVVATYRRDLVLVNALQSLAIQTYDNFEVILVDDNCDESWNKKVKEIVDKVLADYPKLNLRLIVNNPNKGSANARNEGIFSAKGEYLTFLDDDDVYLSEKLEKQVKCITEADKDFCITDLYLYDHNEVLTDKRIRNYIKQTDMKSLLTYHLKYHITGTDTLMFRASFIQSIGGFPPIDVGDEFYLVLKAIENNVTLVYLPGCDVKAYIHNENGGLSTGVNKIKGENALWEKKKQYYSQLDKRDIKFINMRHYAVLAVAGKNTKNYKLLLKSIMASFFTSPTGFVRLFFAHKG